MKNFLLLLLLLSLVWWCGSCARPRIVVPEAVPPEVAAPEEAPECDVSKLRAELLHCEDELKNATGERTNCLVHVARLAYLLGELSPKDEKLQYFEKGKGYGETLAREQPAWADGHYWLGMNLCGLAEIGGARRGLKLLPDIIEEMERTLGVNPAYEQAGAHRVLGRIYYECPGWPISVGNIHESLEHLSKAVALAPDNSTNHLFLAETLLKLGKKAEAHRELEQVLKATRHAHCPQQLEEDRQKARRLLGENWGELSSPTTSHQGASVR
ncbi:MAG: TRAP transporter TatT component family protein [Syntrophobacterales bacterium]